MKYLINGYYHKPGVHCISSAIQNYFNFFGINISESMAFGLDCGLGFCYKKHDIASRIPPFYTGGRVDSWVKCICYVFGFRHERKVNDDAEAAWIESKAQVSLNRPILLEIDKSFIEYWGDLPREVPFHMVNLVGFDEDNSKVLLGDVNDSKIQPFRLANYLHETSEQELMMARNSSFHWGEIKNAWHYIEIPDNISIDLKAVIKKAIFINTLEYLSDVSDSNITALKRFTSEIEIWQEMLPLKIFHEKYNKEVSPLRAQLFITGRMFDKVGTGGGNFRTLYANFLNEAADLFQDKSILLEAAEMISNSSSLWSDISHILDKASLKPKDEISNYLRDAKTKLLECIELEERAFSRLLNWSKNHEI